MNRRPYFDHYYSSYSKRSSSVYVTPFLAIIFIWIIVQKLIYVNQEPLGTKLSKYSSPADCDLLVTNSGRLCNQIFEYISLFLLSQILPGKRACISESKYNWLHPVFPHISLQVISDKDNNAMSETADDILPDDIYMDMARLFISRDTSKRKLLIRFNTTPVKQIEKRKDDVLRELKFNSTVVDHVNAFLGSIQASEANSVFIGIHIRRQDYLSYLDQLYNATIYDETLFYKGMDSAERFLGRTEKEITYVIATDNYEWAKSHIIQPTRRIFYTEDYNPNSKGIDPITFDLAALAHCNHSIIDYGTFSFWSAYLTGGHVWLPKYFKNSQQIIDIVPQIEDSGLVDERYHFIP